MDTLVPPAATVYQLRVALRQISPLIWRRLLVRADSTIADLHESLQIAFGWSDEHLHRFVIHGCEYGISRIGAPWFSHDAREVRLERFGWRVGERFLYEYDFGDSWVHDLRVEAIVAAAGGRPYPHCVGGRRAAPPEDCGGPWAFLELRQHHRLRALARAVLVFGDLLEHPDRCLSDFEEQRDELVALLPWLQLDHFDRREVNHRLAEQAWRDPS